MEIESLAPERSVMRRNVRLCALWNTARPAVVAIMCALGALAGMAYMPGFAAVAVLIVASAQMRVEWSAWNRSERINAILAVATGVAQSIITPWLIGPPEWAGANLFGENLVYFITGGIVAIAAFVLGSAAIQLYHACRCGYSLQIAVVSAWITASIMIFATVSGGAVILSLVFALILPFTGLRYVLPKNKTTVADRIFASFCILGGAVSLLSIYPESANPIGAWNPSWITFGQNVGMFCASLIGMLMTLIVLAIVMLCARDMYRKNLRRCARRMKSGPMLKAG